MSIQRLDISAPPGPVTSRCVVYGDTIHIGGITAPDLSGDIKAQTAAVLGIVDDYLARTGAARTHVLVAQVWIKDMALFADMNAVWNAWVDPESPPSRNCVSGDLFRPEALVEITVTAIRKGERA